MTDSIPTASTKIKTKHASLKQQNFDLGSKKSELITVGFGGYYQDFQNGRIYTHHAIGTFEVHGGILAKYKSRGEYGKSPFTNRREFGFPTSDETRTEEGYPKSSFEWGEIIYLPNSDRGVAISGEIYKDWTPQKFKTYGYPVTSNLRQVNTEIVFFERGICIKSVNIPPVWLQLSSPLIGNPGVVQTDLSDLPIKYTIPKGSFDLLGGLAGLNKLLSGRIVLRQVRENARITLLKIDRFTETNNLLFGKKIILYMAANNLKVGSRFDHSPKLYDLVCKNESSTFYNLSPHCIYTRKNWDNFGLLHVTDIHVSRRIDGFKSKLKEAKNKFPSHTQIIDPAISELNNWNNGFRDFIRYANAMYKKGIVDGVLATGDLIDYLFETGENKHGGGNFKFFRDILIGRSPYPEKEHMQEELLVPIFTSLGNHDYRVNPYQLYQRIDIPIHTDEDVKQFDSFNLSQNEARIIQGGNPSKFSNADEGRIKVSTGTATEQVIPATQTGYWKSDHLNFYKTYINSSLNTLVRLDKHKLLMVDTGPDVGSPDGSWDKWDAITTSLGFGNSDEVAFQERHSPNSKGPDTWASTQLKQIKSTDGIIIIGMHAPPINSFGNEYPHYFRETEHAIIDELEIVNYIRRHEKLINQGFPAINNKMAKNLVANRFPDWLTGTSAFKFGSHKEFLDEGVSRGDIMTFLKLICGHEGSKKPADLLLCGHDHTRSEIRIKWSTVHQRMEYYTDFYSENPSRFHTSKKYKGDLGKYDLVKISIKDGARVNQPVEISKEEGNDIKLLAIPPYADPLNESSEKEEWWNKHKPLLIQGSPLGPTEHNNRTRKLPAPSQPSSEGCKLIIIRDNQINKINHISRRELSNSIYTAPAGIAPVVFGNISISSVAVNPPLLRK